MRMEGQPQFPQSHPKVWHFNPEDDHLQPEEGNDLQRLVANEVFGNVCTGEKWESCCMRNWVTSGGHDAFRTWVETFIKEHQGTDKITLADIEPAITSWKEEFNPTVH